MFRFLRPRQPFVVASVFARSDSDGLSQFESAAQDAISVFLFTFSIVYSLTAIFLIANSVRNYANVRVRSTTGVRAISP